MTDAQGAEPEREGEAPKLIIDTDWKSQAQSEKERLAAQEQARGPAPDQGHGLPEADFTELVRMLTTQALLYMGAVPDPTTGKAVLALDVAKYHIDLLTALEAKTKGNLSEEESSLLSQTAHELRLEFVNISKALARAIQEGKINPAGGHGAGAGPGRGPATPPGSV
ncbi:MAG: DUF1844 domain-containing protein [Phycisphaerales bacterium JB039]